MDKIEIRKRRLAIPTWVREEDLVDLVQTMYHRLDETFPVVTATNGHHYRRERNLRTFIAHQMKKAYKKGLKHHPKLPL